MRRLAKASSAGSNRATALGVALFAVALLTLGLASTALAADQTYVNTGSFGSEGTANGELTHPRRIAVESSTGNVLVADRDNGRIEVFAATAEAAEYLTQFGAGTLEKPFGVAIDQSSGDVYVSDPGTDKIFKFNSDGAPTPTYTLDGTFTSPAKGSGAGEVGSFEADLAVDPSTGDLLVADPGNNRVDRYESDGTFDSSFNGSGSPDGAFTGLLDLDVAPNGDIYVVDSTGPVFVEGEEVGHGGPETCVQNNYCFADPSRVLRFDSSGAYQSTVQGLEANSAALVTVDPSNGQVLVGQVNPQGSKKIDVYSPAGTRIVTLGLPNFFTWFPSMAIGGSPSRLYAVTDRELQQNYGSYIGEVSIKAYRAATLPEVTIDPIANATDSTAEVSGTVDPHGTSTPWRVQYREEGAESFVDVAGGSTGEESGPVPVSKVVTGLQPHIAYEVRIVATGPGEKEIATPIRKFMTDSAPPIVLTRFAAPRTDTTARLNATVDSRNEPTAYRFEWGATASYGNETPFGGAGSGGISVLVAAQIGGLQPNTTYHYRVVAENGAGTVAGEDKTFTTRTSAEMIAPQRGIELVNSPDKANQNPQGYLTDAGEKVVWSTMTGSPGSPIGKSALFMAERTPSGWVSHSMLPKAQDMIGGGELGYTLLGASSNYSKLIYQVGEDANLGVEGDPFTLARLNVASGTQEELDFQPHGGFEASRDDNIAFTSADGSHFYTTIRVTPMDGSPYNYYDIGTGSRRLVSVMPDTGEAPACGVNVNLRDKVMSSDGRRFYFMTRGDDCASAQQIYMRDDQGTADPSDDTTTRVSPPPVAGPEGKAIVVQTNASGNSVVYVSAARLTASDSNEALDLYRWTIGGGTECLTCFVPDAGVELDPYEVPGNFLVSSDFSHIYISTSADLAAGPDNPAGPNMYLIENGKATYVSPGVVTKGADFSHSGEVTPSGDALLFYSQETGITTDGNGGFAQYYRYEEANGSLECLSCGSGSAPREADLRDFPRTAFGFAPTGTKARLMSSDGNTVAFVTATAIDPEDANGGPDLYEWHDGKVSLVTDGEGEYGGSISVPMTLGAISADGTDILFRVSAKLTGFERDDIGQLFVARLGGGFTPPNPPAPCNEDSCQGPLESPPPFTQPGSAGLVGPAGARNRAHPKPRRARCGKGRKARVVNGGKRRCVKSKAPSKNKASGKKRSGK